MLRRFDALRRFLLKRMNDPNIFPYLDGVNDPKGIPSVAKDDFHHTTIKSDEGVQGLPCDCVCRQGKPCTPDVISNAAQLVCITFNRIPEQIREVSFSRDDALNPDFSGLYRVAKHIVPIRYEADTLPKLRAQLDGLGKPCDFLASLP